MATNDAIKKLKGFIDKEYKEDGFKHYVSWGDLTDDFVERIPTGSLLLDDHFGSGFVRGALHQFFGPEGGSKSTLASFIAAAHQRAGIPVLYIDAENKFQPEYTLNTTGFNAMDETTCLFSQEENSAVVYTMLEKAADSGFGLAIVDSTDALMTPSQAEADMGEMQMMQHARMHSESLRKIKGICNRNKMSVIFISQERTFLVQGGGSFSESSGGKAIKFYCLTRNKIRRLKIIEDKDSGEASGIEVEIKNVKNQGGIPWKTSELTIMFNKGFDTFNETIELAIKYGPINKGGGGIFKYPSFDTPFIKGKENVITWFHNNPEAYTILQKETEIAMKESRNKKNLKDTVAVEENDVSDMEEAVEEMDSGVKRGKRK